jgi:hypothetical protein
MASKSERSDIPIAERAPCPVCGSTSRAFALALGSGVYAISGMSATLVPGENVPADQTPAADELRGVFEATLRWQTLGDNLWMIQVLNADGEVVEGGIGDNPEEALLEVYERVIPPTAGAD